LITGMGPTYLWFQFYQLVELAKTFGFSEDETRQALEKMVFGTIDTMFKSKLTPSEVMDLIPVKPIGEYEETIKNFYKTKLPELYNKIKP
jgi:pyrroline-5-carboxylate reductase